ncbi:hypothetical protein MNB_SUP05-SYMBIONT-5-125 [hydrothermal vent metagenome]|uniref:Mobile element protein n=1 Tax=hydrothermal vent metagenome TaxID=652676 RepID=A0A1W1E0W8_9ZZZZ
MIIHIYAKVSIKSATLKLFHYETIDEYSKHLAKFLNYYNFEKKLKRLKFKSPYDKILSEYNKSPSLFFGDSCGCCVGLNI